MTITCTHFPAGEQGFFRAPVLLAGATDAILIDGGFTLGDGRQVAAAIAASGKRLTTIYVSQSDPDYYFSLGPIHAAFPQARVIAAEATVEAIRANVQKKLAAWGPKLGDNGPRTLADVVIPQPSQERTLELEGADIQIVDAEGLPNRRYLWIPSLRAIVGGVLVFSGVHVWTADTPRPEQRQAWMATLDGMAARKASLVVPGHLGPGAPVDPSALDYTRRYLETFERELSSAKDAQALVAAMNSRYPAAGMGVALDIGAKVAKGETKWG